MVYQQYSQYPAGQTGYSYGNYGSGYGGGYYSQSGYGGSGSGAYNGSTSIGWSRSYAPSSNTASYIHRTHRNHSSYGADQYGSNQQQYSYGQQPSTSSYTARIKRPIHRRTRRHHRTELANTTFTDANSLEPEFTATTCCSTQSFQLKDVQRPVIPHQRSSGVQRHFILEPYSSTLDLMLLLTKYAAYLSPRQVEEFQKELFGDYYCKFKRPIYRRTRRIHTRRNHRTELANTTFTDADSWTSFSKQLFLLKKFRRPIILYPYSSAVDFVLVLIKHMPTLSARQLKVFQRKVIELLANLTFTDAKSLEHEFRITTTYYCQRRLINHPYSLYTDFLLVLGEHKDTLSATQHKVFQRKVIDLLPKYIS